MKSFSVHKSQFLEKIDFQVGSYISEGADGEVYNILERPNQVVKFCILYSYLNFDSAMASIKSNILSLIERAPPVYARAYVFDLIGKFEENSCQGQREYCLYYYTMEKCFPISKDEEKVFDSVFNYRDLHLGKKFNPKSKNFQKLLNGLAVGLDFEKDKVISFYKDLDSCKILHLDLAPRNVMKNHHNEFVLIDFDRLCVLP